MPQTFHGLHRMRIANLLFDLDGTLTDSRSGIIRSIRYAMRALGAEPPPEESLGWCVGPPMRKNFARLLGTDDSKLIDRAFTHFLERYESIGYRENRVYEGIIAMLSVLAPGRRLFVATSKLASSAERILAEFELREFFEAVFGSDRAGRMADKRELVPHVLGAAGLEPRSTAIVGDRVHDIEGGRAAGILTIAAGWGYGTADELSAART
ncbi:MAG TPA: HAD hydrolase-like protein [Candidatus Binataceae bacterium]|nr:HAD hydrolase-like protein [Candidatus Binataceae bacterium]